MRVWLLLVCAACSFEARNAPGDGGHDGPRDAADAAIDAGGCGVAEIAAGGNHTCARMRDGSVYCWGSNNTYELGAVTTDKCNSGPMKVACSAVPLAVAVTGATALGLGNSHTCVASPAGTACWGYNKYGAFGDATTSTSATPRIVSQRAGATQIAGGVYHTCSVAGGGVSCSGQNVAGEVGDGTATTQTTAVAVFSGATALGLGEYISCAIDGGGQLWCWGHNNFFQIDGTGQNKLAPTSTGLTNIIGVAAGRDHLCALAADHTISCRGSDTVGQLGAATIANATQLSANHNHTCALDTAGAVWCVGEGYGPAAVSIALPGPASAVTSGVSHDCAVAPGGQAYCWGNDDFGQLGNGAPAPARSLAPQAVALCP